MKDGVTVREATADDARGIARVLVDGWKTTYTGILPAAFLASFNYDSHETGARQHLKTLPATSAVFVALTEDTSVLGMAYIRKAAAGPKDFFAELDAIYVLPSAQRRRVGSRLLFTVVRWLKERGHRSMFLWVFQDNPYRRFYDLVGGSCCRSRDRKTSAARMSFRWHTVGETLMH